MQEYDQYGLCNTPSIDNDYGNFVSINLNKDESVPISQQTIFSNVVNDDQIFDTVMADCKTISEKLNIHPLVAFMVLESQSWNTHLVYENWGMMSDSMLSSLGVRLSNANEDPSLRHPEGKPGELFECEVCCEEVPLSEMWCLPCGHLFCSTCWKEHVRVNMSSGQHLINCQQSGCKRKIPPNSVEQICGKKVYNDFLRFLMDSTVSLADTLTVCPSPKCSKPVNVLSTGLCNVLKCSCGHEFCSLCNEPSHAPANCVEKSLWLNVTGDEQMNKRLLGPNCKICPNCKAIIEKNGGCFFMRCIKCKHEFCWMCLRAWSNHPNTHFNCKYYKESDDPYLKKMDDLSKDFVGPFHENYIKRDLANKAFFSKIDELSKKLKSDKLINETELGDQIKLKLLSDLLNELFWTKENIRWSFVRLFNLRYQVIKNAPLADQTNESTYPNTQKFKIFKFIVNETEENIKKIEYKLFDDKAKNITYNDVSSLIRRIQLMRESLLKHCDPHYE